jgi:hypothetical protein
MANGGTIAETGEGLVQFLTDELRIITKRLDASGLRLGAPEDQRALGKLSGDIVRQDNNGVYHHEECVLVIFKQTENADGRTLGARGGEIGVFLKKDHTGSHDDAMQAVMTLKATGVDFHVPVRGVSGGGDGGNSPRFFHEGGTAVTIFQADGNIVTYDIRGAASEADWRPVWASGTHLT